MSDRISNSLTVLAGEITDAHQRIRASAELMAKQVIDLGHKLIAAKAELPHGAWTGWLEANTTVSSRSAQRYMKLASSGVKSATVADLGLRAAEESLARAQAQPDLDDGKGWPMPPAGGEVLIADEKGAVVLIWPDDTQPSDGPQFFDFVGITEELDRPVFYSRCAMRALGLAHLLQSEGFLLTTCIWDIRSDPKASDVRKTLKSWRREEVAGSRS